MLSNYKFIASRNEKLYLLKMKVLEHLAYRASRNIIDQLQSFKFGKTVALKSWCHFGKTTKSFNLKKKLNFR